PVLPVISSFRVPRPRRLLWHRSLFAGPLKSGQAKKKPGAFWADRASLRELDVLHACLPHGTPAVPVEVAFADHAALRSTARRDVARRNRVAQNRRVQ